MVLDDVCLVVCDWVVMCDKVLVIVVDLFLCVGLLMIVVIELSEFLCWLVDDNFIFFGFCEYEVCQGEVGEVLQLVEGFGLGIFVGNECLFVLCLLSLLGCIDVVCIGMIELVILIKINVCLQVYCLGYMDYVGVLCFDVSGKLVVEQCFFGLFFFNVYMVCLQDVLLVCEKVEVVLGCFGFKCDFYLGKLLCYILEMLLCDELFQFNEDEFYQVVIGILELCQCVYMCLFVCCDCYGCFFICMVFVLCECFNIMVCEWIEGLLCDVLYGEEFDLVVQMGEVVLVCLYVVVCLCVGEQVVYDVYVLEEGVVCIVCNWQDEVCDLLVCKFGVYQGVVFVNCYVCVMLLGYIDEVVLVVVVFDIEVFFSLDVDDVICMLLYWYEDGLLCFKVIYFGELILFFEVLLMLENMGVCMFVEYVYSLENKDYLFIVYDFEFKFK